MRPMLRSMIVASVAVAAQWVVVAAAPAAAIGTGVWLGPLETTCLAVDGAGAGDLAIANLTVTQPTGAGFLHTHARDATALDSSSINFEAGETVANLTATRLGSDGQLCITQSDASATHVVVDLVGYVQAERFRGEPSAQRLLDTRTTLSPFAAGESRCVVVPYGAPGDLAFVNVTVTQPAAVGYLTVHPRGADPNATSTHNFVAGDTVATLTTTVLGDDRTVCATLTHGGTAHVIFDGIGVVDRSAVAADPQPRRLVDTRQANTAGPGGGRVSADNPLCVAVPGGSQSALGLATVTVTEPDSLGWVTAYDGISDPASVSTHNFRAGQTIANLTATRLGPDATLCVEPSPWASAHVIVDHAAVVLADAFVATGPATRRLDTRQRDLLDGRYGNPQLRFDDCAALLERWRDEWLAYLPTPVVAPSSLPATNGNTAISDLAYSTTNTQTAGIDEGDLVETDGRYLYTTTDATLSVIDVAAARTVASMPLAGDHAEMILHDDRLILTTRGPHVQFSTTTTVTTIDVSNPTAPSVVGRYGLDGTRVAMRSIDGRVHVVLDSFRMPDLGAYWMGGEPLEAARQRIASATIEDWVPRVFDVGVDGSYANPRPAIDCNRIGIPTIAAGSHLVWIVSDDIHQGAFAESTSGVVADGYSTSVYASGERLYLATGSSQWWLGIRTTTIHRFGLDGPQASYETSTDLPGHVLDQFSMGEHDGVLRVAVTEGWGPMSTSAVFALRNTDRSFERLSVVTGLGLGEQIFAVRHLGARSFVVTFRQVDPLYVVDFADPHRPRLAGELKIPGFSTYLHPVGDGLLIGAGSSADDDGRVTGASLSLFDVSDLSRPRQLSVLEYRGARLAADHRGFLFWPSSGTIALPMISNATGTGRIEVARIRTGPRLVDWGELAASACAPVRTLMIGRELVAVSSHTVTIADRSTLDVRATIGSCPFL